jgi:hypothetical protein
MLTPKHYIKDGLRRAAVFDGNRPVVIVDTIDEAKALASLCNHDLRQLRKEAA